MSNQFISNKRQKLKEKKVWVCRVRVPKQLHQMLEKYPSGKEYLYSISQAHYTLRVLLRGFGFSGFGVTIRILTLAVKKLSNQVQQCKNDPIHENPKTHAKKQQYMGNAHFSIILQQCFKDQIGKTYSALKSGHFMAYIFIPDLMDNASLQKKRKLAILCSKRHKSQI